MNPNAKLHDAGQSLWLDNITRAMLDSGELERYLTDYAITGLTSNPSIFDKAIGSGIYDDAIARKAATGLRGEELFFELAVEDLQRAADIFRPIHDATDGVDGFVSLEVSPTLAYDTDATVREAKALHERADRPNLFIKIPGTPQGLPAIEECIAAGVPINVTLLFSAPQYLAAADAYLKGIERRHEQGLNPAVASVASVFMSRWDVAVAGKVGPDLANRLALAVGKETFAAYRETMDSDRFQRLANVGARTQRLLWASTGTKDPNASDTLYVQGLTSPFTVNTMPDQTLKAFADHGEVGDPLPADGGDAEQELARFAAAGVDVDALATELQTNGAKAFVDSWNELLAQIEKASPGAA